LVNNSCVLSLLAQLSDSSFESLAHRCLLSLVANVERIEGNLESEILIQ